MQTFDIEPPWMWQRVIMMEKKGFWQRLKVTDNKMAYGILIGIGMGLAMGLALGDWATGVAIGVGVGAAIGAGWSQQTKKEE